MANTQTKTTKASPVSDNETAAVTAPAETVTTGAAKERPKRLIYLGPNIPGGILSQFQTFKGGTPIHCKELFKKIPAVGKLFVDVEKMSETQEKIKKAGTTESRLYAEVLNACEKGGV